MNFKHPTALVVALLCSLLVAPLATAKSGRHKSRHTNGTTTHVSSPKFSAPIEKRDVPASVKNEIYSQNGISKADRKNYVIDHRVPLELKGTNDRWNLQPQTKVDARNKDRWENYLAGQVRSGKMNLAEAQTEVQKPHASAPPRN